VPKRSSAGGWSSDDQYPRELGDVTSDNDFGHLWVYESSAFFVV
jgi:hypothetical protein